MADDIPSRVAVLEQIARSVQAALERIERRLDTIEAAQRTQFLWLLGAFGAGYLSLVLMMIAMLGIIAHTQHWI